MFKVLLAHECYRPQPRICVVYSLCHRLGTMSGPWSIIREEPQAALPENGSLISDSEASVDTLHKGLDAVEHK